MPNSPFGEAQTPETARPREDGLACHREPFGKPGEAPPTRSAEPPGASPSPARHSIRPPLPPCLPAMRPGRASWGAAEGLSEAAPVTGTASELRFLGASRIEGVSHVGSSVDTSVGASVVRARRGAGAGFGGRGRGPAAPGPHVKPPQVLLVNASCERSRALPVGEEAEAGADGDEDRRDRPERVTRGLLARLGELRPS
jgi:hypothetical protein